MIKGKYEQMNRLIDKLVNELVNECEAAVNKNKFKSRHEQCKNFSSKFNFSPT